MHPALHSQYVQCRRTRIKILQRSVEQEVVGTTEYDNRVDMLNAGRIRDNTTEKRLADAIKAKAVANARDSPGKRTYSLAVSKVNKCKEIISHRDRK